jgi:hypothetical protein
VLLRFHGRLLLFKLVKARMALFPLLNSELGMIQVLNATELKFVDLFVLFSILVLRSNSFTRQIL